MCFKSTADIQQDRGGLAGQTFRGGPRFLVTEGPLGMSVGRNESIEIALHPERKGILGRRDWERLCDTQET